MALPRQSALLPKHTVLTPRELVLFYPRLKKKAQASRQPNSINTPQGSPRDNLLENPNPKWVMNLSSKPLTQAQRSVLAKGPNFAVTCRHPPNLEYITAIEVACTKLGNKMLKNLVLKSVES